MSPASPAPRAELGSTVGPPDELPAVLRRLSAGRKALSARRRDSVLARIDEVVAAWLAPGSPWLERAVEQISAASGFSPPMVRFALPAMLEPLRAAQLDAVVGEQARDRCGPPLIAHILPGNLPGLAAIPAALSLAIGSAALLKPGRGDRRFPSLFIDSLAARDADLAAALAAVYWPGGDRTCEDIVLAAADLVVAGGDDDTVAALRRRARGRFIGHGHRISFAVVAADSDAARAAADLAIDVATWDQRGCLSPQVAFVEGDTDAACAFAAQLAAALERQAIALPPGAMDLGERLAVRRWRDEAAWAAFDGEPYRLFAAGDEAAGTVVVETQAALRPTPLWRCVRVAPLARVEDLGPILAACRGVLEGAGLAASPERWPVHAAWLQRCGVHLAVPIGAMQRPPLAWRQGGRPRLADWLEPDRAS